MLKEFKNWLRQQWIGDDPCDCDCLNVAADVHVTLSGSGGCDVPCDVALAEDDPGNIPLNLATREDIAAELMRRGNPFVMILVDVKGDAIYEHTNMNATGKRNAYELALSQIGDDG